MEIVEPLLFHNTYKVIYTNIKLPKPLWSIARFYNLYENEYDLVFVFVFVSF